LFALPASAQTNLSDFPSSSDPITISAESANQWQEGGYEVWLLRGNCRITQGDASSEAREAVVWIDHARALERRPSRVIAYLEGDVVVDAGRRLGAARLTDQSWLGRYYTSDAVRVSAAQVAPRPGAMPPVYQRGAARVEQETAQAVRPAQYMVPQQAPPVISGMPAGTRRIRAFPRSNVDVQAMWFPPNAQSNQGIILINSGVNLIIDGLSLDARRLGRIDSIDLSADRVVVWVRNAGEPDLTGEKLQDENVPVEIYMEGNIVFRQGERVIYADRMYYDVNHRVGTVINAEILTPVPKYEGLLRLHAQVVQQTDSDHYAAQNAFMTSSRMGQPGYRVQAGDIEFEDIQMPAIDPATGQPLVNAETGQPALAHQQLATSHNNLLYFGPVPIFYWPVLSTNLTQPTYFLRRARIKNDQVFGTQILTDWDMFQLLGIKNPPAGTDWSVTLDYLSSRGLGHGTTFLFHRDEFLGLAGPLGGLIDFWGIGDRGNDDLGADRRSLQPERDYRYKLFGQYRQQLPGGFQLSAELGWLSDRNFLQQYYEEEWDELKDMTTGLELKHTRENISWSITADARVNDFFTQTEWLPRADHFWLGQPLFNNALTWYEHSSIGYARFERLDPPSNPADQPFNFLPWEINSVNGERLATRHELDWPFQLGPVKLVPFVLGELAHWGEDINGNGLDRVYGQAGLRATLPMWRVDPTIEDELFNVHGIAHKVVFSAEFAAAGSNRDMMQLLLYDPLDDDSIEAFRRRLAANTFGSPSPFPPVVEAIPPQFDERLYALRTGLANWVASPSTEIADDMTTLRMGVHQRWQTKRGTPGHQRIIDWITLDSNITWFPNEDNDFSKAFGLLDYYAMWHVGDRLTLVSDGIFDFFSSGQQIITMGGFLTRPPRGSLYLGMRLLEGPINSQILAMSYNYWMSPKWVSSFGMSVDLGQDGNLGQNLHITRIGESLLVSAGVTVDVARNNVGANFVVEPRFMPRNRLNRSGGVYIPPAGAFGLE
jgi:hypothetical protein